MEKRKEKTQTKKKKKENKNDKSAGYPRYRHLDHGLRNALRTL